jgi:hypothetical protein
MTSPILPIATARMASGGMVMRYPSTATSQRIGTSTANTSTSSEIRQTQSPTFLISCTSTWLAYPQKMPSTLISMSTGGVDKKDGRAKFSLRSIVRQLLCGVLDKVRLYITITSRRISTFTLIFVSTLFYGGECITDRLATAGTVFLKTAPSPEGPWTEGKEIYKDEPIDGGLVYAGIAYPHLDESGETLTIGFTNNNWIRVIKVTFT